TFEDDLAGIRTRDLIGLDNLLWGNDYPHHDAIWPNSMKVLDQIFEGVPDEERKKLVWSNGIALYGIDEQALLA
ncbi:MAG: amidohydrolase family protein, partial [Myxococcota bacterium]